MNSDKVSLLRTTISKHFQYEYWAISLQFNDNLKWWMSFLFMTAFSEGCLRDSKPTEAQDVIDIYLNELKSSQVQIIASFNLKTKNSRSTFCDLWTISHTLFILYGQILNREWVILTGCHWFNSEIDMGWSEAVSLFKEQL